MLPVVIACSHKKIKTNIPVRAVDLYKGELFSKCLHAATYVSDKIYILSAGYGLLELGDLVLPYNIKMTLSRAL